jgi:putative oxidoreductase
MFDRFSAYQGQLLSILRIVTGLVLLQHGTQKLLAFPDATLPTVDIASQMGAAGIIELVGGVLFTIGLLTRPVAFVLAGFCAAAYFIAHFSKGFYPIMTGGDLAVVLCFLFLYFVAAGAGPWSVDAQRG